MIHAFSIPHSALQLFLHAKDGFSDIANTRMIEEYSTRDLPQNREKKIFRNRNARHTQTAAYKWL